MEVKISSHKNSVDQYTAGSLLASNFLCVQYAEGMHSKSQATEVPHVLFSWKTEMSILHTPFD